MTDALTSRFSATCFTGEVEVGFDTDGNIEFTKGPNQKYTLRSNAGLRKRVQATSGPSSNTRDDRHQRCHEQSQCPRSGTADEHGGRSTAREMLQLGGT